MSSRLQVTGDGLQEERDAALCDLMMALNVQRNRFGTGTVVQLVRDALTAEERETLFWLLAAERAKHGFAPTETPESMAAALAEAGVLAALHAQTGQTA